MTTFENTDVLHIECACVNDGSSPFSSPEATSESSLTNLIGSGLNLLCLQSHSKPECRGTWPEIMILNWC